MAALSPVDAGARRAIAMVSPSARTRLRSGVGITRHSLAWAFCAAGSASGESPFICGQHAHRQGPRFGICEHQGAVQTLHQAVTAKPFALRQDGHAQLFQQGDVAVKLIAAYLQALRQVVTAQTANGLQPFQHS